MKRILCMLMLLFVLLLTFSPASAERVKSYRGVPSDVVLSVSSLDNELIYVGIDLAVFQDGDKDGIFTVKEGKAKRFLTNHTTLTIDLGHSAEYEKGVVHKLAMRTLYVPTGYSEGNGAEEIIIADYSNGREGWVLIPGTEFMPTYFAASDGDALIRHTDKWEQNRQKYNESKIAAGQEYLVRPYNVFWSGEKFLIHVETTEEVPAVRVSIEDSGYLTVLTAKAFTSDGVLYQGELWDKDMLNKWGNYIPKTLTFTVDALNENGTAVETIDTTITIENRDLFYRVKRAY